MGFIDLTLEKTQQKVLVNIAKIAIHFQFKYITFK